MANFSQGVYINPEIQLNQIQSLLKSSDRIATCESLFSRDDNKLQFFRALFSQLDLDKCFHNEIHKIFIHNAKYLIEYEKVIKRNIYHDEASQKSVLNQDAHLNFLTHQFNIVQLKTILCQLGATNGQVNHLETYFTQSTTNIEVLTKYLTTTSEVFEKAAKKDKKDKTNNVDPDDLLPIIPSTMLTNFPTTPSQSFSFIDAMILAYNFDFSGANSMEPAIALGTQITPIVAPFLKAPSSKLPPVGVTQIANGITARLITQHIHTTLDPSITNPVLQIFNLIQQNTCPAPEESNHSINFLLSNLTPASFHFVFYLHAEKFLNLKQTKYFPILHHVFSSISVSNSLPGGQMVNYPYFTDILAWFLEKCYNLTEDYNNSSYDKRDPKIAQLLTFNFTFSKFLTHLAPLLSYAQLLSLQDDCGKLLRLEFDFNILLIHRFFPASFPTFRTQNFTGTDNAYTFYDFTSTAGGAGSETAQTFPSSSSSASLPNAASQTSLPWNVLPDMYESLEKLNKVHDKQTKSSKDQNQNQISNPSVIPFQHGNISSLDINNQPLCHPLDQKIFICNANDLKRYQNHIPSFLFTAMNIYENALQLIHKNVKNNWERYRIRQYYYSALACFLMYTAQYGVYRFDLFDDEFNTQYITHRNMSESTHKHAVSYQAPKALSDCTIWPCDLIDESQDAFWHVLSTYISAWYQRADVKTWDIRKFTKQIAEHKLKELYWQSNIEQSQLVYTAVCSKPSIPVLSLVPTTTPAGSELVGTSTVSLLQAQESINFALGSNNANNQVVSNGNEQITPSTVESITSSVSPLGSIVSTPTATSSVSVGKPYDISQYTGEKSYNERLNCQLALHRSTIYDDDMSVNDSPYPKESSQIFNWASETTNSFEQTLFFSQKSKGKHTIDQNGNIMLPLLIRNVPSVQLNVYEIDIFSWYQKELTKQQSQGQSGDQTTTIPQFDPNLDLEGFIPNYSTKINLVQTTHDSGFAASQNKDKKSQKDQKDDKSHININQDVKSYQKYIANIVLNGFGKTGVLIIELLNDTMSLRTCIHQGCFSTIQKPVKTGTLVMVLDAHGHVVPDARIYIGNDMYTTFGMENAQENNEKNNLLPPLIDQNNIEGTEDIVNSSFIHIPAYTSSKIMLLTDSTHLYTSPILLKPKKTDISLTCQWFVSSESLTNAMNYGGELEDLLSNDKDAQNGRKNKKIKPEVALIDNKHSINLNTSSPSIVGGGHLGGEVLLRPSLYTNGTLIDLSKKNSYKSINVIKSTLLVTATLQNGTEVTDLVNNFHAFPALQDDDIDVGKNVLGMKRYPGILVPSNESIHPFAIPTGLRSISFTLSLTIEFEGKETDLTSSHTTTINKIHTNESISTGMLILKQLNGSYFIYSIDKSGLPIPFHPVSIALVAGWLKTPYICSSNFIARDPKQIRTFCTDQNGCFELGSLYGISKLHVNTGTACHVQPAKYRDFTNMQISGGFSYTLPTMSQIVSYPTSITITIKDSDIQQREHVTPTTNRSIFSSFSSSSLLSSTLLTPASPSVKKTTLNHTSNLKQLQSGTITPQASLPLPFNFDQEYYLLNLVNMNQDLKHISTIATTADSNYNLIINDILPSLGLISNQLALNLPKLTHEGQKTPPSSSSTLFTSTNPNGVLNSTQIDILDDFTKLQDKFYTYLIKSGIIQLTEMGYDPSQIKNREIMDHNYSLINNTIFFHNLQPNRNYMLSILLPTGGHLVTMIRTYREPIKSNLLSTRKVHPRTLISSSSAHDARPSTTLTNRSLSSYAPPTPSPWGSLLTFLTQSDQTVNKIHDYIVLRNNAIVKIHENSLDKHLVSTNRALYCPQTHTLSLQLSNIDYKVTKLMIFGSTLSTTPSSFISHIQSYHTFTWNPELTDFTANPSSSNVNPRLTKITGGEISGEREYIDFRRNLLTSPDTQPPIGIMLPQPSLILNKRLRQKTDAIIEKKKEEAKKGTALVQTEVNLETNNVDDILASLMDEKECMKLDMFDICQEEEKEMNVFDRDECVKMKKKSSSLSLKNKSVSRRDDARELKSNRERLNHHIHPVVRVNTQGTYDYSNVVHTGSFYNIDILRNKSLLLCNLNVGDLLMSQYDSNNLPSGMHAHGMTSSNSITTSTTTGTTTTTPTVDGMNQVEQILDATSTVNCTITYPLFSVYSSLLIYVYNTNTNTFSIVNCPIYIDKARLPYHDAFTVAAAAAASPPISLGDYPVNSSMQSSFKATSFNSIIPQANQHLAYVEQHSLQVIPDGIINKQSVVLCQQNSIEYEMVNNINELYTMMLTMLKFSQNRHYDKLFYSKYNNNTMITRPEIALSTLNKYQPLYSTWSTSMTLREKLSFYDRFYCHEMNLYLFFHDRIFFECIVRPYVVQKLSKDIIDLWLVSQTLLDTSYLNQAYAHYLSLHPTSSATLLPLPNNDEFYQQQIISSRQQLHFIHTQYFSSPSGSFTSNNATKHRLNVLEIILLYSVVNPTELYQLGYFMRNDQTLNQSYSRDNTLYVTLFESCLRRKMLTLQEPTAASPGDDNEDNNDNNQLKEPSEQRIIYRDPDENEDPEPTASSPAPSTIQNSIPTHNYIPTCFDMDMPTTQAFGAPPARRGKSRGGPSAPSFMPSNAPASPLGISMGGGGGIGIDGESSEEESEEKLVSSWKQTHDDDEGETKSRYKRKATKAPLQLHRAKDKSTLDDIVSTQLNKKKPKSHTPYVPLGKTGEYEDKFYYIAPEYEGKLPNGGMCSTGNERNTVDFIPFWTYLWCDFAQFLGNPLTFSIDNDYASQEKVNTRFVTQHLFDISDSTVNEYMLILAFMGLSNNPSFDKAHIIRNVSGCDIHQGIAESAGSDENNIISPFSRTIPINTRTQRPTMLSSSDYLVNLTINDTSIANSDNVMYTIVEKMASPPPSTVQFTPYGEQSYPFIILTKQLQQLLIEEEDNHSKDAQNSASDDDSGDDSDESSTSDAKKTLKNTLTAKHYYIDVLKSQNKGKLIVTKPNKLQYNRPYRCQVVITNATSSTHNAQAYVELPQNSLPISVPYGILPNNNDSSLLELNGILSSTQHIILDPYASNIIAYSFYIPKPLNNDDSLQKSGQDGQKLHTYSHYGVVISTTESLTPQLFYHAPPIVLECCPAIGNDISSQSGKTKTHDGTHDHHYIAQYYNNDELCAFLQYHFAHPASGSTNTVDLTKINTPEIKDNTVFNLNLISRRLLVNVNSPTDPISAAHVKKTFEFYIQVVSIVQGYLTMKSSHDYTRIHFCDMITQYAYFWLRLLYMINYIPSSLPLSDFKGKKDPKDHVLISTITSSTATSTSGQFFINLDQAQFDILIWALNHQLRKRSNEYLHTNRGYVSFKQFNHYDYFPYLPARIHNTSIGMNTVFIREQQEQLLSQQIIAASSEDSSGSENENVSLPADVSGTPISPASPASPVNTKLSMLQTIFHGDVINTNIPNAQLKSQYQQLLTYILMNTVSPVDYSLGSDTNSIESVDILDPFPHLPYQYILSLIYYTLIIQQSTTPQLFSLIQVMLNKIQQSQQSQQKQNGMPSTFTSHIQFAYLLCYIDILFMGQLHTKITSCQFQTLTQIYPQTWPTNFLPLSHPSSSAPSAISAAANQTNTPSNDFYLSAHLCRSFKTYPIPQWATLFNQTEQYLLEGFVDLSLTLADKKLVNINPAASAEQVPEEPQPLQYDENSPYNVELQRSLRQDTSASTSPTLNAVITHTPTTTVIDIIYNDKIIDKEIILELFYIDSELLLSQNPFIQSQSQSQTASMSTMSQSTNQQNSNLTRPHILLKVPVIFPTSTPAQAQAQTRTQGLYKQSITLPAVLTTNANVTIKALQSALVTVVPLLHSGFIVQIQEKQGIISILNSTSMKPVSGAYIKVFTKNETVNNNNNNDKGQVDFLCDKYTDIRGKSSFMDASNSQQGNNSENNGTKRTQYAIIVSHQKLGTTVAYCNGPQK